jgi:hypothetical protein
MENRWNAVWTRFMQWLDQYAAALAYDPIGDLHAGIARLDEEVQALRSSGTLGNKARNSPG